jgi:hypothetical protein
MRPALTAVVLLALGAGGCNAKLPSPPVPPNGKWVIVPIPSGVDVPPDTEKRPAVWRLNTQTGDLQFCYRSSVNGIDCGVSMAPPATPLIQ